MSLIIVVYGIAVNFLDRVEDDPMEKKYNIKTYSSSARRQLENNNNYSKKEDENIIKINIKQNFKSDQVIIILNS